MMPAVIYAPLPLMRQGLLTWFQTSPVLHPQSVDTLYRLTCPPTNVSLLVLAFDKVLGVDTLQVLHEILAIPTWLPLLLAPRPQLQLLKEQKWTLSPCNVLPVDTEKACVLKIAHALGAGQATVPTSMAIPRSAEQANHHAHHISQRESEILQLIVENEMTNEQIANRLFISKRTVDTHRRNLLRKVGVHNTVGLVKYALRHPELNSAPNRLNKGV